MPGGSPRAAPRGTTPRAPSPARRRRVRARAACRRRADGARCGGCAGRGSTDRTRESARRSAAGGATCCSSWVRVVVGRCFEASCRFAGHPRKYAPEAQRAMIGIIGGTGLYAMEELRATRVHTLTTPFGAPSAPLTTGTLRGREVAFLARHGLEHHLL